MKRVPGPGRQRGVLMICFALMLVMLLGFIGLALDLSQLYNRKLELQNLADDVALAAARSLDGTATGLSDAVSKAATVAQAHKYQYAQTVTWSNAALSFSSSADTPDGGWLSLAAAQAAPSGLLFARVDTSALDPGLGQVTLSFLRVLPGMAGTATTSSRAVAGRSSIKLTPLAICAMSSVAAASRDNPGATHILELVEYGFRRGVGYNLLNLNPNGDTPVYYYLDPLDPLGATGSLANLTDSALAPFVCDGVMPMTRVTTARISVTPGPASFPLAPQLNSRFDQSPGVYCSAVAAPPDANVRAYTGSGSNWWMNVVPATQTAAFVVSGGALQTVADPLPAGSIAATSYGPLWSYGPAAVYAASMPAGGYSAVARTTANWATLYPGTPSAPAANGNYPALTPYGMTAGSQFLAPSSGNQGVRQRRVLNIPLLACPVAAGSPALAQVLAIGRFFMTAPATSSSISGEFAGAVDEQTLGGTVELYQ